MRTKLLIERVEKLEKRIEGLVQVITTRKRRAIGTLLEVVKVMVDKPVARPEEDIEKVLRIVGISEGTEDLSANLQPCLQGVKK